MFWAITFFHLHCSLSCQYYISVSYSCICQSMDDTASLKKQEITHHIQENISNLLFDVPVLKSLPQLLKKHLMVCKNCRYLQYKIKNKLILIYALSVYINVSFQLLLHPQWWMCQAVGNYCLRITNPWYSCCHSVKLKFYSVTCTL